MKILPFIMKPNPDETVEEFKSRLKKQLFGGSVGLTVLEQPINSGDRTPRAAVGLLQLSPDKPMLETDTVGKGGNMSEASDVVEKIPGGALITSTPEEGRKLAIAIARHTVKSIQPDMDVLRAGRPKYVTDADSFTAAAQVVAIEFQTIAAANDYWK